MQRSEPKESNRMRDAVEVTRNYKNASKVATRLDASNKQRQIHATVGQANLYPSLAAYVLLLSPFTKIKNAARSTHGNVHNYNFSS